MIRATAATWINHGTTLVFQVAFAAQFGTSSRASAFVVAFAAASALGSVFVSTAISVGVPRLTDAAGRLTRPALRFIGLLCTLAVALGVLVVPLAPLIAAPLASLLGVSASEMAGLILVAAAFFVFNALFGVLGSVLLARGRRFLPAVAPAMPTAAGALFVIAVGSPSVTGVLGAVALGALIQLGITSFAAWRHAPATAEAMPVHVGWIAALTVLVFTMFSILPILQRIVSAVGNPADAVRADYAFRGIIAAEQLLVGGVALAALPRWADRDRRGGDIRSDVALTMLFAGLVVITAASVAFVVAPSLTALLFQRGAFTSADSAAVGLLVRIGLIGFIAESLTLVFVQGVLAKGRNDLVLRAGFLRLTTQITLTLALGLAFGVVGVALAYSVSLAITFIYLLRLATTIGLSIDSPFLRRSFIVWSATAAVGVTVLAAGVGPAWLSGSLVLCAAYAATWLAGLHPLLLAVIRRGRTKLGEASLCTLR